MRKTYCDRCGKQFEYENKDIFMKNMVKTRYDAVLGDTDGRRGVDICAECQEQLNTLIEDFMKGTNV